MESNYTWKNLDWSIPSLYFTFSCIRGFVICVLLNNLFGEKPFAAIELLLHSLHILKENSTRLLIVTEVQKQPNPVMTGWTFVLMFFFYIMQQYSAVFPFLLFYLFICFYFCIFVTLDCFRLSSIFQYALTQDTKRSQILSKCSLIISSVF